MNVASREEILKIPKAELYSPDLSYLKKAPQNSLAGRLAKPTLQPKDVSLITEKRKAQRLAREQETSKSSTPASASETHTPKIERPDVATVTQKRVEDRLAREAKEGISIPYQRKESSLNFLKADHFNKTIRTVQDNASRLTSLGSLLDSSGPLPLARSAGYRSTKPSNDELSPLALKRREERRLRENNSNRNRRTSSRRKREHQSDDMGLEPVMAKNFDSANPTELEAASATVHAPEFNGPESISETINDFNNNFGVVLPVHRPLNHGQHSVKASESFSYRINPNMIDSFAGGDYSKYTSLASANNSTSPNALTAMKTAELALSYQRDYVIPQRKHAIEIVKTLVGAKLDQAAKERQTTA